MIPQEQGRKKLIGGWKVKGRQLLNFFFSAVVCQNKIDDDAKRRAERFYHLNVPLYCNNSYPLHVHVQL